MKLKSIKIQPHNPALAQVLLRLGLGFVFLYAAIATLAQPYEWAGYVPGFLLHLAPLMLALRALAIYELFLGIGLLSGLYTRYASILCALTLAFIVVINPGQLIVTFRDIGLLFAALSLFLLS